MPQPTTRKAVDTYALKRAVSLTAAATIALAICHQLTRTSIADIASSAFPIIGIALIICLLGGPILFSFLYGRQDAYSIPRTIFWSWATNILAIIGVWTLYGIALITFA